MQFCSVVMQVLINPEFVLSRIYLFIFIPPKLLLLFILVLVWSRTSVPIYSFWKVFHLLLQSPKNKNKLKWKHLQDGGRTIKTNRIPTLCCIQNSFGLTCAFKNIPFSPTKNGITVVLLKKDTLVYFCDTFMHTFHMTDTPALNILTRTIGTTWWCCDIEKSGCFSNFIHVSLVSLSSLGQNNEDNHINLSCFPRKTPGKRKELLTHNALASSHKAYRQSSRTYSRLAPFLKVPVPPVATAPAGVRRGNPIHYSPCERRKHLHTIALLRSESREASKCAVLHIRIARVSSGKHRVRRNKRFCGQIKGAL